MREFSSTNLPYVDYKLCKTPKDVEVFFDELKCNIIIKPLDSNSSHGVFKITAKEQIHEKFDETISFSKVEKVVLAERYIEGTEFTIDGLRLLRGMSHLLSQKNVIINTTLISPTSCSSHIIMIDLITMNCVVLMMPL